jgi:hypothetical protein
MAAVTAFDPRRLAWTVQRVFLRHGLSAWLLAVGIVLVAALAIATLLASVRLQQAQALLEARTAELRHGAAADAGGSRTDAHAIPLGGDAFATNRRLLAAMDKTGLVAESIRFKFEPVGETGLTRQVAVFTVRAPWAEVARLLDALQRADRALYIARLRLQRENADDPLVEAEIQLATTLPGGAAARGAMP